MRQVLVLLILISSFLPAKAVFTNFANPEKKKIKTKYIKKTISKKIIRKKEHKIKSAIIWHLPQREFLGKEFNSEEQNLIDTEALTRFIEAASLKNPEAFKIYRSKNKNSQLIKNLTGLITEHSELLNNYIESKDYQKEKQKEFVANEIKSIQKLYTELKKTYREGSRTSKDRYQELKNKISSCCGLENFLYVENLLKREINFEVFST